MNLCRRWRPGFHVIPASGWLNDPCALGFHAASGVYVLGFQWNPVGWNWENISWGAAKSSDMIHWDVSRNPSLAPSATEDTCGVFTGCMVDSGCKGDPGETITCFYTSAQKLPIHYTLEYQIGSEKLHMATSIDGGMNWRRLPANPLLAGPPSGFEVTGWRDPFVFRWQALDLLLQGTSQDNLYGIVAGGIRDSSPTIFLYSIDSRNHADWTFLSTLVLPGKNFAQEPLWGDFGLNWEVTNIFTIQDELQESFEVVITGVEGCREPSEREACPYSPSRRLQSRPLRTGRAQKWFSGKLCLGDDHKPQMKIMFGGHLDYGAFYAANSLFDPMTEERIVFGWILEDDLPDGLREQQGWSGFLSIPRILKMTTIQNVTPSSARQLASLAGSRGVDGASGTSIVTTLWQGPDPRLKSLRDTEETYEALPMVLDPLMDDLLLPILRLSSPAAHMEVEASFILGVGPRAAGLKMFLSSDLSLYTTILFDAKLGEVSIDRDNSCYAGQGIRTDAEVAPHTLLETMKDDNVHRESLRFHIYFDVSSMEVFINNRVVISTRVYPESGSCYGVQPILSFGEDIASTSVEILRVWSLKKATMSKAE